MSMHTPDQDIIPPDQPVAPNLKPVLPAGPTAGMTAAGPLGALIAGLAIFGLFVFGATHTEQGGQSQQAAAQQTEQSKQAPQNPAVTGIRPQDANQADTSSGTSAGPQQRETTGAAPVEQQRETMPNEAKTGVPGR